MEIITKNSAQITILLPVCDGMPYLKEAIDSILTQTYRDILLFIINDGSKDGTEEYINKIVDPRVLICNRKKEGLGASLNFGLRICETNFLARMDSDDISFSNRLEKQINYLHEHKEIGLVGTQIAYMMAPGRKGFSPPLLCDHIEIRRLLLRGHHSICHPTIMCRTSLLKEIGGYRINNIGEDLDMFLRFSEISKVANMREIFYLYRISKNSVNAKKQDEIKQNYAYAIHCAKQRLARRREPSIPEFIKIYKKRGYLLKILDRLDIRAIRYYRMGLADVLENKIMAGYAKFALAIFSSPRWITQRIFRNLIFKLRY